MYRSWWPWVAALVCLLLYLPGLFGPFTFDTVISLVRNDALDFKVSDFNAWRAAIASSDSGPLGRPVSMFTFSLTHGLYGQSALLEKSVNLLLHLAIGLALFYWLRSLLRLAELRVDAARVDTLAFFATLLWLLNPLQVSTVLYAVQRMEQLSTLFTLLALGVFTTHRSAWMDVAPDITERSRALLKVLLLGLLAVFSKEDGILLVGYIALLEALVFRGRYAGHRLAWVHFLGVATCIVPVAGVLLLALVEPAWLAAGYGWRGDSPGLRLLTQARVLWHYVGWFYLLDTNQMSLFHDDIAASQGLMAPLTSGLAVLAWLLVIAAALFALRVSAIPALGVSLYLFSHGLESTVLPLDMAYEHRNYLGNAGLALILVWAGQRWLPTKGLVPATALLLVATAVTLGWRSYTWGDELRLNSWQLRNHPRSERAVYYYANLQLRLADEAVSAEASREHVLAARRYFEYLLELDAQHLPALVSLIYVDSRWFPELEREALYEAMQAAAAERSIEPSDANAFDLLLRCIRAELCDIPRERVETLLMTLTERYPADPRYPALLARYLGENQLDFERAMALSRQAIAINPESAEGYYLLASWQIALGQRGQAAVTLAEMLGPNPDPAALREVSEALR